MAFVLPCCVYGSQPGVLGVVVPAIAGRSTVADFPSVSGVPDAVGIHTVPNVPRQLLLKSPQYTSYTLFLAFLLLQASRLLLVSYC